MRTKKVRGHNRLHKEIERWRQRYINVNLQDQFKYQSRYYVKLWIHPWSSISLLNSQIPAPGGKTRQLMLSGLLDIYDSWKKQLEELGEPYYLKIWLHEPNFLSSQVVCATGDFVNFYDNTFYKPETKKSLNLQNYGHLAKRMQKLNWIYHLDEMHLDDKTVGEPYEYASLEEFYDHRRWFSRKLKKLHRTTEHEYPDGEKTKHYSVKTGAVWIGGD